MDLLKEEKSLFFITENKLESKIEDCYYFFFHSMCFLLGKYIQTISKEFVVETTNIQRKTLYAWKAIMSMIKTNNKQTE